MHRSSGPGYLIAGALLGLFILYPGLGHAQGLSKDEQKCVNEVNKNVEKVTKAQGKDIDKCTKDAGKGKLTTSYTECLTSDNKGKVVKATGKLSSKVSDKCAGDPAFPPINTSDTAAMNERAKQKELLLINELMGTDLDGAIVDCDNNKDGCKCQAAVVKQMHKCQNAKLKSFNKCKKDGLKGKTSPGLITSTQELQDACMNAPPDNSILDGKGKIAKECSTKLGSTISGKCAGNTGVFPGCGAVDAAGLEACVDQIVECEVCKLLNEIDGLDRDCDDFDDGLANSSCGEAVPVQLPSLDHFKVYQASPVDPNDLVQVQVTLEDQFGGDPNVQLEGPIALLNPVKKTHGGEVVDIVDPLAHLTFYTGFLSTPVETFFAVTVRNQFGDQLLNASVGETGLVFALIPARKEQLGPSPDLDHFKCYLASGSDPNQVVRLQDQFDDPNEQVVTVREAATFCNPANKNGEGIQDPNAHLTCYVIEPNISRNLVVNVGDQFDPNQNLIVDEDVWLCVPSTMLDFQVLSGPLCIGDPNRTFVGGPFEGNSAGACKSLLDQVSCDDAYHQGFSGVHSCFWDPNTPGCFGCGGGGHSSASPGATCTDACIP